MLRRRFVLSLFAISACGPQVPGSFALAPNSTLIVVRHSDREGEDLTTKGIERSHALVSALENVPLDGIYSPGIKRNLDTAAPLEQARGLTLARIPAETPTGPLTRRGAGKTVIWVGNKGNIRRIWEDLSLPEPAPLNYGDLHIIRSDASGQVTLERLRFGPDS